MPRITPPAPVALAALSAQAGIDHGGGGIAASNLAFAPLRAGRDDHAVHDRSLDQGGRDAALPTAAGPG